MGAPREYDQAWYGHQVPGGMISNLRHQLKLMGKEEKFQEVLEEISQVRAELGYPIMVTPFAQFVGSQAAINVMVGERYKEATDQVIQYALGLWGKEGSDAMDQRGQSENPRPDAGARDRKDRLSGAFVGRSPQAIWRRPFVR